MALLAAAHLHGGCTGAVVGAVSSVNATIGDPSSARLDHAAVITLLVAFACIDIVLTYQLVNGEDIFDLGEHRRELETDLARGEGAFVSDLAAALALPDHAVPQLGAALRNHRAAILASLSAEGDARARLTAVGVAVRGALAGDPVLTEHLARARVSAHARGLASSGLSRARAFLVTP